MSVNIYDKTEDKLISIAGDTVYADAPIGSIIPFGGSEQGCPAGWLICNGNSLSKNDYFDLWKVIGYRFGGSDSTFNLPDLRETVPVGIGENDTQTIEAHDVYTLGQFKDDQLQDHQHTITPYANVAHGDYSTAFTNDRSESAGGLIAVGRHGTTTHGKQLGVNYIIKAKHTPVPADFMDAVDDAVAEFAPVDTVENGNMKAVTSNAVAKITNHTNELVWNTEYVDLGQWSSGGLFERCGFVLLDKILILKANCPTGAALCTGFPSPIVGMEIPISFDNAQMGGGLYLDTDGTLKAYVTSNENNESFRVNFIYMKNL